ncbi:CapA family protein [Candidatus Poriferisodalis sp.]|uniref:CapA family protein n=1 Tax=Candidatus Poriferisodalis sp. TaxID=3101277 RepID=UPI003B010494
MVGLRAVALGCAGLFAAGVGCASSPLRVAPPPPTSASTPAVAQPTATPLLIHDDDGPPPAPVAAIQAATTDTPAAQIPKTQPPTTQPDARWTLLTGGDVLMDRSEAAGIDPFADIEPALRTADIAIVNAEMVISARGRAADKRFVFRAPPTAADRIAAAGVDVANLANNHAMDYGTEALTDTVDHLEARGVIALGAGSTGTDAYRHRVIEVRPGLRVAFVGASLVVPHGFPASDSRPGIASAYERDRVLASVRSAARDADVVIAAVHWGIERTTCPNRRQRDLAQELLRSGADAVVGHHPHVLQPVAFDDGKLVAYSLGNFVWHYRSGITGETGVLQIDFDGAEITGWSFHPHVLDLNGAPVPVSPGSRADRIADIIAGDCARHQPPPTTAPPTTPPTSAPPTTAPPTTAPSTTTTAPTTTAPTAPTTSVPTTGVQPSTSAAAKSATRSAS